MVLLQIQQIPPEVVGEWTATEWEKVPVDKFIYFTSDQIKKIPVGTLKDMSPDVLKKFGGMLEGALTSDQAAALSGTQEKALDETRGQLGTSKDVLDSVVKEWDAKDRLDAATIALDEGRGTASISAGELAELEAEHKGAQQDYEAAVADREHAEAGRPMSVGMILLVVAGVLLGFVAVAVFVVQVVMPKRAKAREPPLGSKHVAVALENGNAQEQQLGRNTRLNIMMRTGV